MLLQVLRSISALVTLIVSLFLAHIVRQWFRQAHLHRLPGPKWTSLLTGNMGDIFSRNGIPYHMSIVKKFGRVIRIWGWFGDTQLYISDPKALYAILVKDQYTFEETSSFILNSRLSFGPGLTGTLGEHHRRQRKLLNPVFSISHMRHMTPTFFGITYQLCNILAEKAANGPKELNMLDWMGRVALEIIGQGGLGYSFDALNETSRDEFATAIRAFSPTSARLFIYRHFLPFVVRLGPPSFRKWVAQTLPWRDLNNFVDVIHVMHQKSSEILEGKRRALEEGLESVVHQVAEGKDIMSVLLKANMSASEDTRLPDEELLAQMSLLVFAAMDTTSSALSRILHVLSQHPDAQEKLRTELRNAFSSSDTNGYLDYDTLHELPYLEAVCRETLRLYAPVTTMARTCRKDTMVPLDSPITIDGKPAMELLIPEDTTLFVGIRAVNRDPAIWGPDAHEWKPERFLSPLPESVTDARVPGIYANLLTFLGGGRACIGFKFSQLEMKVVLSLLVSTFRFAPTEKHVEWKMGIVSMPAVEGPQGSKPSMPLMISLAK